MNLPEVLFTKEDRGAADISLQILVGQVILFR